MENLEKDLLTQDRYISENEYKKYAEKENLKINLNELKKRNDLFVKNKLVEYDSYFNNIFEEANLKINLDDEQREIILRDDDYCLINAGAGTGKSTTMAAKVKYLVDKLNVNPKEIIMLSFTKKSSEDLDEKVNESLNLGIPVSTFHSLGMQFIRLVKPGPVKVADDVEKKKIIEKYVETLFNDKEKLLRFIELFKVTKNNRNGIMKGFVDNAPNFNSFDDYFLDYKKRKFDKERKNGGINRYVTNRLKSKTNLNTINGEVCKSLGEVNIANFLNIHNIDYKYEKVFEERVDENKTYEPDFTIEYAGKTIYIEYFGMSECIENNKLIQKRVRRYNRIRRKKEQYQRAHLEYDFINLDYRNPDGNYLETLKNELLKRNVNLKRISDEEIFDRMISNNKSAEFFKLTSLMIEFISILKNMLVDNIDYIFDKRIKEIENEQFKELYYSADNESEKNCRIGALNFLKEIYYFYQDELIKNDMIDYDDMINDSYKYIIKDLKNNNTNIRYKYIIVDEYQDITFQRFLFVKRLIEFFGAKLIAVGDDWQCIYSFSGSRLELFNKFSELYQNDTENYYLSTTYRYGQELVELSSEFLLVNEEQSKKDLKSIKHLEKPIEIVNYYDNEEEIIYGIVEKIYKENPNALILILARTNKALHRLQKSEFFIKGLGDVLVCKEYPNANIEAITMHRSKGLTADQVIVFGLQDSVFPSKGYKYSWIFDYFRLDNLYDSIHIDDKEYQFLKEKFPYAEERRLFYVALTRTKNKVYLVAPESANKISEFVLEMKKLMNKKDEKNEICQ